MRAHLDKRDRVIQLDWGWPSPELQATDTLASVMKECSGRAGFSDALFYGQRAGNLKERESLAAALTRLESTEVHADSLILTSGAGVGLDLLLGAHNGQHKLCFTQALTYHNALGIIRDRGFSTEPLRETEHGAFDFLKIEEQFRRAPGSLCYLVPTYSNPGGTSIDVLARKTLIELATRYDVQIISDEVYRFLSFDGEVTEPLAELDPSGEVVVSLGSFTKLGGPGLRLGWLRFGTTFSESSWGKRVLGRNVVVNGGCLNQFSAWVVAQWLSAGYLDTHVTHIRRCLSERASAFVGALRTHLPADRVSFESPEGGYFIWLDLQNASPPRVLDELKEIGVVVRDASVFRSGAEVAKSGFRLSFSYYGEEALCEAACRLGRFFHEKY